MRTFASRALKLHGNKVIEAASGEEALKIIDQKHHEFDIFVTDVIMKGLDGPSWVTRAIEDCPDTKVIFMSGYAEDSFDIKKSRIPYSEFLAKPISLNQLAEIVEQQLALDTEQPNPPV